MSRRKNGGKWYEVTGNMNGCIDIDMEFLVLEGLHALYCIALLY